MSIYLSCSNIIIVKVLGECMNGYNIMFLDYSSSDLKEKYIEMNCLEWHMDYFVFD